MASNPRQRDYYAIQRLSQPRPSGWSPHAFGGGSRFGGFTEEAVKAFQVLFSPDYMGKAQYEWGDVPKAVSEMQRNKLDFGRYTVKVNEVDTEEYEDAVALPFDVFLFCPKISSPELMRDFPMFYKKDCSFLKDPILGQHSVGGIGFRPYSFFFAYSLELRERFLALLDIEATDFDLQRMLDHF